MDDLLKFESDCMTIQIIYNSIGKQEFGGIRGREAERRKYINNLGYLYPGRDKELNQADSFEKLREAVTSFEYEKMLSQVTDIATQEKQSEFSSTSKTIGKIFS